MSELTIPVDELSSILNKAILDSLSAQTKETLIEGALKHLMTSSRDRYNSTSKTPLQEQFEMAVNRVANQVAEEVIAAHPVRQQLVDRFTEIINQIDPLAEDTYQTQEILIRALVAHISDLKEKARGY